MQLANQEHLGKRDHKVLKVAEASQAQKAKGVQLELLVPMDGLDCLDYRESGVHEVQLVKLASEALPGYLAYLVRMGNQVNAVFLDDLA